MLTPPSRTAHRTASNSSSGQDQVCELSRGAGLHPELHALIAGDGQPCAEDVARASLAAGRSTDHAHRCATLAQLRVFRDRVAPLVNIEPSCVVPGEESLIWASNAWEELGENIALGQSLRELLAKAILDRFERRARKLRTGIQEFLDYLARKGTSPKRSHLVQALRAGPTA